MLQERTLTEIPLIEWSGMVRVASKSLFFPLDTPKASPLALVARIPFIKPKGDFGIFSNKI